MKYLRIISSKMARLATTGFLIVGYVLGIGIVSTIGKLIGKQFIEMHSQKGTWRAYNPSTSADTMY